MEGLPILDRQPARRPTDRGAGGAAWLGLCLAALLASTGSSAEIAQTPAGVPGWQSAQLQRSAVGDPEQGQRVAEEKCVACHGADGNSPDPQYPKLAAQNPAYLHRQLRAFESGSRKSEVMSGIVATLSDADMADAAAFYSRQPREPDTVKDQRLATIGERLFFSGMPACAMCHGSAGRSGMPMMGMMGGGMMGMMGPGTADVPKLDGQHAAYIIDQLNRFADGDRPGTVMTRFAAGLSETSKKAVAEFLSGVP